MLLHSYNFAVFTKSTKSLVNTPSFLCCETLYLSGIATGSPAPSSCDVWL